MLQGCRLFKGCRNLPVGTVLQGCRLFKPCRNLSAGTVLHGCRLFKRCGNISAGTVLQGCRLFKQCRNLSVGVENVDPQVRTTYEYVVNLRDRLESTVSLAHENLQNMSKKYMHYYNRKSKRHNLKVGD